MRLPEETVRRILDIAVALVLLILLTPLFVALALTIRTTSPGAALYRQMRVGYRQRPFVMLKFRSMYADSDDRRHREFVAKMMSAGGFERGAATKLFKLEGDPRITPVGHLIRKSSLDELPQLVNVLRGEMSLVGPRPCLAWEVDLYQPHQRVRFEVKPGITGLWQVSGRSRLSMSEALELDAEYVRRRSLRLDIVILARTLPAIFMTGTAR